VFWGLRLVLVGFMLVIMVKNCKFGVLDNIGRFRGTFGVDLWLLVFSFVSGGDPVLGVFLTCFGVSIGFR